MASTFTNLIYHIVYATKFRQPLITGLFGEELHKYIGGIIREHEGSQIEIGGISDHVHILARSISATAMFGLNLARICTWSDMPHSR